MGFTEMEIGRRSRAKSKVEGSKRTDLGTTKIQGCTYEGGCLQQVLYDEKANRRDATHST